MIVLDTHTWVWWVAERSFLSPPALSALSKAPEQIVCPISCWEVAMLVQKQRLKFAIPPLEWIHQALQLPGVRLQALTPAIAVRAAGLLIHGDPADRLIVATAMILRAPLVTKDEKLRSLDCIQTVW